MKEIEITGAVKKRFESRLGELLVCENGCIEWTGSKTMKGYGRIRDGQKVLTTHRVSWSYFNNSDIPKDMVIMHKCDNRVCVNPSHLNPGTISDNTRDMCNKNRHRGAVGSKNSHAKLTELDVVEIRRKLNNRTQQEIAFEYGISQVAVSCIKLGKTWKNI